MASLAIIIPTLDASAALAGLLPELQAAEIVVSDGGSGDDTAMLARTAGAILVEGPAGRGGQLARGAKVASGEWLLFLHADTRPGPGWRDAVERFVMAASAAGDAERAGYFRFRLDDDAPAARRLERMVAWRCRVLGLPYGDQGLLISRRFYHRLGGFRPIPLMEDVDLVRRIGHRRLVPLDADAVTSAGRYRRDGYLRRSLRNLLCLGLWAAGVPAPIIRRLYG
jgi:rSAM/selenodomain-associated transferase 2